METPKPRRRSFEPLFHWKTWRVILVGVASFATLLALFHAEENWRGERDWEHYKAGMEARGVVFDFVKFIPPPVLDDQNFAMTPFLAPLFAFVPGTQHPRDTNAVARIREALELPYRVPDRFSAARWPQGEALNLVMRANAFRKTNSPGSAVLNTGQNEEAAREILATLQRTDPVIEELRNASRRPYCRFNIAYDTRSTFGTLLPHFAILKQLWAILELRACADLTLGRIQQAEEDTRLLLYLTDSTRDEPFLISLLVRFSGFGAALQPIWEGLRRHQWSDAQLADFMHALTGVDFIADAGRALAAERSLGNAFFTELRAQRDKFEFINNLQSALPPRTVGFGAKLAYGVAALLYPRGWFYFEQLNYQKVYNEEIADVITPNGIDPALARSRSEEATAELSHGNVLDHRSLSRLLSPSFIGFDHEVARAQDQANLAVIACALERYRLAHGQYPDSLEALAPRFLQTIPHDAILGFSFVYRRNDHGQFILYSVGWNKKDDLGKPSQPESDVSGDWVWRY